MRGATLAHVWRPLERIVSAFRGDASSVKAGALLGEQGKPQSNGINHAWRQGIADVMTPAYLATVIAAVNQGDPTAFLTLAEEMEEREPHYRSVMATRKMGVAGLPAAVASAKDDAHNIAIATHVEEAIVNRPNFEGLTLDLLDAIPKGFSCLEIMWARDVKAWLPEQYKFRPQRHFTFDKETQSIPLLRTLAHQQEGEPLTPFKWLVHMPKLISGIPIRGGVAMPASFCFAAKRYAVADWLVFLDQYGIPSRIGRFGPDQKNNKTELLRGLERLTSGGVAVIPEGMIIEILEGGKGNGKSFQECAEYWDKQVSKVVLGQTMSSDDGSSLSQAKVHEKVRDDIRAADARSVAQCINEQLIKPFVDLNYGPQEVYPTVSYQIARPEDVGALMTATKILVDMGAKVEASVARDRMGYPEPAEGAELLVPTAKIVADAQPKPEPAATDSDKGEASENDKIKKPSGKKAAELNRLGFARDPETEDTADIELDEALEEWRPLLEGNVGALLAAVATASSFEEVAETIRQLADDEGVVLDVESFVRALAKSTFKLRGVGSATDRAKV